MQRADSSSRVSPLRLRRARSLAPRKCVLRVCDMDGCEINTVKFPKSNFSAFPPIMTSLTRGRVCAERRSHMQYDILILGASYGSLLGTKLLMAGHRVCLVCTRP